VAQIAADLLILGVVVNKLLGQILWGALLLPLLAVADVVVPVEDVSSYVNIRQAPDGDAEVVGRLHRDTPRRHVETVPGWYEVALEDGSTGFVSSDWSVIVAESNNAAPAQEPADESIETVAESVPGAAAKSASDPEPELDPEAEPEPASEAAAGTESTPVAGPEPEPQTEPTPVVGTGPEPEPAPLTGEPQLQAEQGPESDAPAGAATGQATAVAEMRGDENYLLKFKKPTVAGTSQIWDDGNFVGIGTTEPKQRLEVNGSIQIHEQNSSVAGLMITQSSGDTGYILHNRASTLTIGAGSIDRITIDRMGNVGFGVERPRHPVDMASGAYVSEGGVWTNSSSRELKENIESLDVEDALAALAKLEPVQFNYKSDNSERYVGFIAEDVPPLVANNDRQSLSPMDIVAVLTKVIQAQQARIEELERRVAD
jgi:hypothetical protein